MPQITANLILLFIIITLFLITTILFWHILKNDFTTH